MENKQRTHYEILGVGIKAHSAEIKTAQKRKITRAKKSFERANDAFSKKEKAIKREYAKASKNLRKAKKHIDQTLWDKMVEIALDRKARKEAFNRTVSECNESASVLLDQDSRKEYNRELKARAERKTSKKTSAEGGALVPTGKTNETKLTVFDKCKVFIKCKPAVICIPIAGVVLAGTITYSSFQDKSEDELPKKTISTVDETYEETEPPETIDIEMPDESVSIFDMGITRFDRQHIAVEGDTLAKFSIHSNARQGDIKKINNMSSDTIVKGEKYVIPYCFEPEDLRYYLSVDEYDPSKMTPSEFAEAHEITLDVLIMLNREAFVQNGDDYEVITDQLTVPYFNSHESVQELKRSNQKIK